MTFEFDNVYVYIKDATEREMDEIRSRYRTYAPGYRYSKLFRAKKWNGKTCAVDKQNRIPAGHLPSLLKYYPRVAVADRRQITPPKIRQTKIDVRQYQCDSILAGFQQTVAGSWWPRGVLHASTGAGKSRCAAVMIDMTPGVKTLFVVHRKQLQEQILEVFASLGVDTSNVRVTTIQSLMSWSFNREKRPMKNAAEKEALSLEYLNSVEQVFVDEAHMCAASLEKGGNFVQALNLMPNAYMRWGLTATPFMREEYNNWLLEGCTGTIFASVQAKDLIEDGFLCKPNIQFIRIPRLKIPTDWPICYDLGIVANDFRNNQVLKLVQREEGPIMVLVTRIEHGSHLAHKIQAAGLGTQFLHGAEPLEERQRAIAKLRSGAYKVLVGSTIWDEGIDIPEIRTLILAGGGKSAVKAIQRLGRGLRRAPGKDQVNVYDFVDVSSKILKAHSLARQKAWYGEEHEIKVIDWL